MMSSERLPFRRDERQGARVGALAGSAGDHRSGFGAGRERSGFCGQSGQAFGGAAGRGFGLELAKGKGYTDTTFTCWPEVKFGY